jgi:large subunit ribosomal protein L22
MAQIETKKTTPAKVKVAAPKKVAAKKTVAKKPAATPVVKPEVKKIESKLFKFSHPDLKVAPRKLRLLVATVKKMSPTAALDQLHFTNSNAARLLDTVLTNAVNTAKNNGAQIDSLKISEITVDEGKKTKRMDKAHGSRFARGIIIRRHSRLNIVLSGTITG